MDFVQGFPRTQRGVNYLVVVVGSPRLGALLCARRLQTHPTQPNYFSRWFCGGMVFPNLLHHTVTPNSSASFGHTMKDVFHEPESQQHHSSIDRWPDEAYQQYHGQHDYECLWGHTKTWDYALPHVEFASILPQETNQFLKFILSCVSMWLTQ